MVALTSHRSAGSADLPGQVHGVHARPRYPIRRILAEDFLKARWVLNIKRNPRVRVRVGDREFGATARVLDTARDSDAWETAYRLAREKYGWGAGLPVEITPDGVETSHPVV